MSEIKFKKTLNMFAYVGVVFLGIVLLLHSLMDYKIMQYIAVFAELITYTLITIYAYFYVRTKKHIAYMIVYIIAVVLIVTMKILPLVV